MPDVILSEKYIYLFDQDYSQSLYQVDYDGNVLNSIRFGNDDKLNINGINNLVVKNNKVGVVSRGSKIIWFDENLKDEKTEIMATKAHYHLPFQNGYVSFVNRINEEIDFDFVASDESGIIHTAIPIDRNEYGYVYKPYSPLAKYKDQILFTKSFNDTIFVYNEKEGLMPFTKVDFGSSTVPDDQFLKIQDAFDMMNFFNAKKHSYLSGEVYPIDDQKALIGITIKGSGKLGLWDIDKGSLVTYPSLKDDFKSNMELFQISTVSFGKTVFGVSGEYVKNSASESFKNSLEEGYEYSFFLLVLE
ncbi:hypothetical protein Belba_1764 [Belliella baltica DSM 15883]|uniref:Uncharacterized protein n=1 Tax=Belliella baltica (strain DSM 15883 / CIP 108006 / LMG 21964 / BA134) TaxID=866536 RepID=I3Z546_BELBD|nr:6-bladed beta-propeller [Belliella baltica]AFL84364.1 hypothetical protein Belba_1764 [Belliella baltica DSM 15883]